MAEPLNPKSYYIFGAHFFCLQILTKFRMKIFSLKKKKKKTLLPGAIMGGPAHDKVMKKIPGGQGRLGPHPLRGHEEKT